MRPSVFAKSWRDRSRGFIGWSIAIVALVALVMAFYPSIRDNSEFTEALEQIPEGLKFLIGENPLDSPAGYLDSQLFAYFVPAILMVYGIGQAADSIAGEEQRHTMDLLLANPVTRSRVILEKFSATLTGLAILHGLLAATLVLGARMVDMDIPVSNLLAASLACFVLVAAVSALALTVGAASGKKGSAIAISSAVAVAGFLINSLASQIDALEVPSRISPFYYYGGSRALIDGLQPRVAVLVVATTLLVIAAVVSFDRRDVNL